MALHQWPPKLVGKHHVLYIYVMFTQGSVHPRPSVAYSSTPAHSSAASAGGAGPAGPGDSGTPRAHSPPPPPQAAALSQAGGGGRGGNEHAD